MNFAGLISTFGTGTYTVTRRGATTAGTDGRATLASATTVTITASVQNLTGRELTRLPEGMRLAERKKLYTTTALKAGYTPDTIVIGADTWEVEIVDDQSALGGYYKATIAKVGD